MESWGLLIFASVLSVGKANVELYSFYKETDSKQELKHPAQTYGAQAPLSSPSLLQVPLGFQLQIIPPQSATSLGSPRSVLLPQHGLLPGSGLRNNNLKRSGGNHTAHKISVRSDPEVENATDSTDASEAAPAVASDTADAAPDASADAAPDAAADASTDAPADPTESPVARSASRYNPKRSSDLTLARSAPSNSSETQHSHVNLPPAARSQIIVLPVNSLPSHELQAPVQNQHIVVSPQASQLQCNFPEYRAMVCVGDLETTCDRFYRVDPKCPFKQERCLCSEGYVRPYDYHDVHHISGACNPQSSCQIKRNPNYLHLQ